MKAGIFFSGTGPILILTSHSSLTELQFTRKLETKGIKKFIAYEVPIELVQQKYGVQFNTIMGDLKQDNDLRVLDYDGHHIFNTFSLRMFGEPIHFEPTMEAEAM